MHDLEVIARAAGVCQSDLLALAPGNDPFALHQPARQRNAEWFAELFEKFNFGSGVHIRRIHCSVLPSHAPSLQPLHWIASSPSLSVARNNRRARCR